MAPKSIVLYHGTTEKAWRKRHNGRSTLYLCDSIAEAQKYADEASENDLTKPIVLRISLVDIGDDFDKLPDDGWLAAKDADWKRSLKEVGSFAVSGDIEKMKRRFKVVWRDGPRSY